ncbi:MAG: helix-turn-helix domain-containing protein [Chloroflexota bacterium]
MRPVKSPPGSVRAERATLTERRILTAARSLFAERGYGATTLRQIADEAGVAVQTVYAVHRSKPNILRALRESVRDDPDADQAYRMALVEQDPGHALDLFARSIRMRWTAGADIVTTHVEAASVDAEVRAELATVLEARQAGIAQLARSLAALARDLGDVARIASIIDVLTLPEPYRALTEVHGWSPDAYERWLAMTLRASILDSRPGSSAGRHHRTHR